jgi:hypothetical protein
VKYNIGLMSLSVAAVGLAKRGRLDDFRESVVQNEAHIHQAKEPTISRSTGLVENSVAESLHCLVSPFSWVLVLLVWLTLPRGNAICA